MVKNWKCEWLEVIFMQKSAPFCAINFGSKPVLKISTFSHFYAKTCVKPKIGLNGQKMKKQMTRSDFYAKI